MDNSLRQNLAKGYNVHQRHLAISEEYIYKFKPYSSAKLNSQNAETAYDAIILDLTVPGSMGGKEAIEIIKKIDPNVKAYVSSGYNRDPIMANYKEYGFNGLITKPYNVEELNQTLMEVLVEK